MTQLGVDAPRSAQSAPQGPAEAMAQVVENATELAKAELRLAAVEARAWLVRAGLGLALLWLSALLFQVVVLMLALAPLALVQASWARVALAVGLALAPALLAVGVAMRELRRLKDIGNAKQPGQH